MTHDAEPCARQSKAEHLKGKISAQNGRRALHYRLSTTSLWA
jgi:hypothetical protein